MSWTHRPLRRLPILAVVAVVLVAFRAATPEPALAIAATQVSAGTYSTCAVSTQQSVHCWGLNDSGQTSVPSGLVATQVGAGHLHSCALKPGGEVVCWGSSEEGRLAVPAGLRAMEIAVGSHHACALSSNGTVTCWGHNSVGQTSVPSGLRATSISSDDSYSCAVRQDYSVVCWGWNLHGKATVPDGLRATQVSTGSFNTCVLKLDQTIACWGNNDYGQLSVPAGQFRQVSSGGGYVCALSLSGSVQCWGINSGGVIDVPAGLVATQISAGWLHVCALTVSQTVVCWGADNVGQSTPPTLLTDATAPHADIRFNPETGSIAVYAEDEPGGSGHAVAGAIPPTTCQAQRTGRTCVYRLSDNAANTLTLTLQITESATQTRVRVLSVQAPGKPAVTPLTHEAVFDHAPAALQPSSLTQTLSVTDPGPPASSRQVRATWTEAAGQTTVTHVRPAAPNQVLPGRQLLRLTVEASGRISIELPSPI